MNEMNELETQLRSWAPRPPSARISRALFGREMVQEPARRPALAARRASPGFLLNWLAPAVAAVALMLAFFHLPTNPALSNRSGTTPIMAVILSNQSFGSVLLEASNRAPATSPTIPRSFDIKAPGM